MKLSPLQAYEIHALKRLNYSVDGIAKHVGIDEKAVRIALGDLKQATAHDEHLFISLVKGNVNRKLEDVIHIFENLTAVRVNKEMKCSARIALGLTVDLSTTDTTEVTL